MSSKHYLFGIGLARHLQGRQGLAPRTPEYGEAFESFIHQEITAYCSYHRLDPPRYWRSKSGFEVDFVLRDIAVEVKAKANVGVRDWRGLTALKEEGITSRHLLVCMEPMRRVVEGMEVTPWEEFLDALWRGRLVNDNRRMASSAPTRRSIPGPGELVRGRSMLHAAHRQRVY